MLTFNEARALFLEGVKPLAKTEHKKLEALKGSVLARDIHSPSSVPPFDNSAMDGIAIHLQDVDVSQSITISQTLYAGSAPRPLAMGTAARIFTGAVIPESADTVILQEDCSFSGGSVQIHEKPVKGQHIRKQGEDIAQGQLLFGVGHRLRAQDIGLLASTGINEAQVYQPLSVAVIATGDELVMPGESLQPGQIYNSNAFMISDLLEDNGFIVEVSCCKDDKAELERVFKSMSEKHDALVTIGGVSVGEADLVRSVIESLGELEAWKVAMKPGKPIAKGIISGKPIIGLPGNPVSAFAGCRLFALPFLRLLQGQVGQSLKLQSLPILLEKSLSPRREEFLRVCLSVSEKGAYLTPYPHQGSGVLSSVVWADGFARIPMGKQTFDGDLVEYWPFNNI